MIFNEIIVYVKENIIIVFFQLEIQICHKNSL